MNKPVNFDTQLANFTPRQMEAIKLLDSDKIKFLLYGGALGGGKSYFLRWYLLRRLMELGTQGFKYCTAMLACEDYPALKDRQLAKIPREFPPQIGTMHQDHKEFGRCFVINPEYGSGVLCFRNLDDASKYMSSEWVAIGVDELTKNPFEVFDDLRMRLRWPGLPDIACQFVAGTNPGGIGHGWVKQFWMDKKFPQNWITPIDYRSGFAYVPSLADDNPHLDAAYWQMLETLPEVKRRAYRYGDWEIFIGQAFPEISEAVHGVDPIWPIPENAPIYMTYDWGYGKPFSIGWWWLDNDNRAFRFLSWYGSAGQNEGLRIPDSAVAEGIIEREVGMGFATLPNPEDYKHAIWSRDILRISGPDCFNKKPDYKGGGQGPSTAEIFGEYSLFLSPGDCRRDLKIRALRERLRPDASGIPMMLVYRTDEHFFRTMKDLIMDKTKEEDVDTKGEDHIYDESALFAMARPLSMEPVEVIKNYAARIIEYVERREEPDEYPLHFGPDDEPGELEHY